MLKICFCCWCHLKMAIVDFIHMQLGLLFVCLFCLNLEVFQEEGSFAVHFFTIFLLFSLLSILRNCYLFVSYFRLALQIYLKCPPLYVSLMCFIKRGTFPYKIELPLLFSFFSLKYL